MKTKTEPVTIKKSPNSKIQQLKSEFYAEFDYKGKILQNINARCYDGRNYDEKKLYELFLEVYDGLQEEDSKRKLFEVIKKQDRTIVDIIPEVVAIIERDTFEDVSFSTTMPHFFKIIDTDEKLDLFLKNPQKYINDNSRILSAFELQVLEVVINHPFFGELPSVNRKYDPSVFVASPVTTQLWHLNLAQYGSTDAGAFEWLIEPTARETVLAKSKQLPKAQVIGLGGAYVSYDQGKIAQTAQMVRKTGVGACHSFAQLAADHLLKKMEEGVLPPMHVKMVSHNVGLGSHTYLLLDHNSNDLTDLSTCTIVDPWAVVMGHTKQGYGAFLTGNYPFPDMTTNLVLCYDSQAQDEKQLQAEETAVTSRSFRQQLANVSIGTGTFFSSSQKDTTQKLGSKQKIAVSLLSDLQEYVKSTSNNRVKLELIDLLTREVKNHNLEPAQVMKIATQVAFARSIEQNESNFMWKGVVFNKDEALSSLLPAFSKSIGLWNAYSKKHGQGTLTTVDDKILKDVVDLLNKNEEHTFSVESQKTYKF
ncbi:hypothetical protein OQJ18_05530 [Fluoribacter dumoffii]|uniref:hypothetical protein n=1 Tax=Fluoribacter dumoffii TaxID=463 RepID=UPI002244B88B|nr:hypothetical protein [Fluoribacter dumoffii]MCW8385398.1 hypothetical protein [Fluoribacter dumoffii]MCW8418451.1 hypothetical protein [Fluoribacter dumoffii]MCW8453707.1 hypothetical protein [Fluoribacter dumoffii]MCW8462222.1 hypothetical protein [Fluoribacter dumoffii]MCW8482434.1 hypothetical protein [Fluoribacter dumoffii]